MTIKTIDLVATRDRLTRDFPSHPITRSEQTRGIAGADYDVDLDRIQSKLGRWLALQIETTRRGDDASDVVLLSPRSHLELALEEIAKGIKTDCGLLADNAALSAIGRFEHQLDGARDALEQLRKQVRMYGESHFAGHPTIHYAWPVYGSLAAQGADTPEEYFDVCARQIRKMGAVIVSAGLGRAKLPDSLARTMGPRQNGHELLAHHEAHWNRHWQRQTARTASVPAFPSDGDGNQSGEQPD